jgi:hypothetical protein
VSAAINPAGGLGIAGVDEAMAGFLAPETAGARCAWLCRSLRPHGRRERVAEIGRPKVLPTLGWPALRGGPSYSVYTHSSTLDGAYVPQRGYWNSPVVAPRAGARIRELFGQTRSLVTTNRFERTVPQRRQQRESENRTGEECHQTPNDTRVSELSGTTADEQAEDRGLD